MRMVISPHARRCQYGEGCGGTVIFAKELESYGDPQFCKIEWEQLDSLIQQAKEMEEEQIIDAYETAMETDSYNEPLKIGKDYYNETFKSE
jgi:hypothetical protein